MTRAQTEATMVQFSKSEGSLAMPEVLIEALKIT